MTVAQSASSPGADLWINDLTTKENLKTPLRLADSANRSRTQYILNKNLRSCPSITLLDRNQKEANDYDIEYLIMCCKIIFSW